ncbi:MAG TPA: hypothetical protein VLT13_04605 [Bacteroidota bacterium]|nr:hypothetical protein [Bacteroidota bacterium]
MHRRSPRVPVDTKRRALTCIDRVGFCLVFRAEEDELSSLWQAVHGSRAEDIPRAQFEKRASAFLWEMKQALPAEGLVYYGKLLLRRPTMISLEFLPYFYALSGRTGDQDEHVRAALRGELSSMGRRIMDVFRRRSRLSTRQIRQMLQKSGPVGSGSFALAMNELQSKMYIAKGDEDRRPYSFTWVPVRILFAAQVRKARHISAEQARRVILEQHFRNQGVCALPGIRKVFRWSRQEVYQALGDLLRRGIISSEGRVDGVSGHVYTYLS